eukprot:TRINITY_DN13116_c0_g1_i4.p1 TRINITY_DN13116_c0_g1~~TRINITY_DN13116_c0_g1_i4.p1  ORF type:complete len:308 (+),score=66.69 TRINITY_DN13116_c0_g1_i4:27-926(+)
MGDRVSFTSPRPMLRSTSSSSSFTSPLPLPSSSLSSTSSRPFSPSTILSPLLRARSGLTQPSTATPAHTQDTMEFSQRVEYAMCVSLRNILSLMRLLCPSSSAPNVSLSELLFAPDLKRDSFSVSLPSLSMSLPVSSGVAASASLPLFAPSAAPPVATLLAGISSHHLPWLSRPVPPLAVLIDTLIYTLPHLHQLHQPAISHPEECGCSDPLKCVRTVWQLMMYISEHALYLLLQHVVIYSRHLPARLVLQYHHSELLYLADKFCQYLNYHDDEHTSFIKALNNGLKSASQVLSTPITM